MFKFFRRYNKWILVIGGSLLMVAFLIPEAIQGISRSAAQRGATWARVGPDEREVTVEELDRLQRELRIVEKLEDRRLQQLGASDSLEHWFLLTREAEQAGLIGGPSMGRMQLAAIGAATPERAAVPEEALVGFLQSGSRESAKFIYETMAKVRAVHQLIDLQLGAGKLSDRRLAEFAADMLVEVDVDLVAIRATPDGSTHEPTEAELEAQLKEYGEVAPGSGKHGFGYRMPHRVKLEWMTIPIAAIRAAIERTDAVDGVAVAKYWQKNQAKFATEPGTATGLDAVRPQVREALLNELTAARMAEIGKFAGDLLSAPLLSLKRDGIHYVLPGDWASRDVSFTSLAETLGEEFGIATPSVRSTGPEWKTQADLAAMAPLGNARTTKFGTAPMALPELVRISKELDGSATIPIQKGVAGPVLTTDDGSVHFFRILDVDPSHAPASVDEVRADLVRDIRTLKHFESLKSQADTLRQQVLDEGLVGLASSHNAAVEPVKRLSPAGNLMFRARGFKLPIIVGSIGEAPALAEAIAKAAAAIPTGSQPTEVEESKRIVVEPVESALAVAVARIVNTAPLTREKFNTHVASGDLQLLALTEELNDATLTNAFGLAALEARHKFKSGSKNAQAPEAQTDEKAAG